jgi:hypothetical protein
LPISENALPLLGYHFGNEVALHLQLRLQKDLPKMAKILQPKYTHPVHSENPSIMPTQEIARVRSRVVGKEQGIMFNGESGDLIGPRTALIYEHEEVDSERFVKLYLAGFKQAAGLSKSAMAVFELVYHQLQDKKDSDQVLLVTGTSGMSASSFSRGLRELMDRGFIFRSPYPSLYWVNIRYIFNGDRLAFVKSYSLQKTKRRKATTHQVEMFGEPNAD